MSSPTGAMDGGKTFVPSWCMTFAPMMARPAPSSPVQYGYMDLAFAITAGPDHRRRVARQLVHRARCAVLALARRCVRAERSVPPACRSLGRRAYLFNGAPLLSLNTPAEGTLSSEAFSQTAVVLSSTRTGMRRRRSSASAIIDANAAATY